MTGLFSISSLRAITPLTAILTSSGPVPGSPCRMILIATVLSAKRAPTSLPEDGLRQAPSLHCPLPTAATALRPEPHPSLGASAHGFPSRAADRRPDGHPGWCGGLPSAPDCWEQRGSRSSPLRGTERNDRFQAPPQGMLPWNWPEPAASLGVRSWASGRATAYGAAPSLRSTSVGLRKAFSMRRWARMSN